MLVIGLTGGIGSGKSTVADLFAKRSIPVIDADQIAKTLTEPQQPAFTAIIEHFSTDLLQQDGTLDRKKLRQIIFADVKERAWLEKLLHPLIRQSIEMQIQRLTAPYCIVMIPLLLEVGPYAFLDRILVIDTTEDMQLNRVAARDKAEKQHIEAILNTQLKRDERLAKADDVIKNDGVFADLIPQVEKLHNIYLKISRNK